MGGWRAMPIPAARALADTKSDLICKADEELRPLRQVLTANVMIMKR